MKNLSQHDVNTLTSWISFKVGPVETAPGRFADLGLTWNGWKNGRC